MVYIHFGGVIHEKTMRRLFGSLLCLALLVCLVPTAWAVGDADAAAYETRLYGKDIIVGFESPDPPVIDTAYKYALIELRKEFPVRLNALMGGTAFYERDEDGTLSIHHVDAASTQEIDVGWKCLEDYDEDPDVFHFVPVHDEKKIAEAYARDHGFGFMEIVDEGSGSDPVDTNG